MAVKWYTLPVDEVFNLLYTSNKGLSLDEVALRQKQYGRNLLPRKRKTRLIEVILRQFFSPLIYVLLAAAVLSLALQEYSDAFFILLILLINALIGTLQEWKAETSAEALHDMIRIKSTVVRHQKAIEIDAEEIVPGDIVLLESGHRVPADLRIFQNNNLTIEESILTGESVAVTKTEETILAEKVEIADQLNMAFAGTMIVTGKAKGVVVGTGNNTEIGKIAGTLSELKTTRPPLVKRMERFSKRISIIVLIASITIGIVGFMNGIGLKEIFFFVVAVAVSAIPEGLPIAMTVALAIGTTRMAKRNVIVRKLTAVEGLGSCTVIATDKTGTLTVDQQTVRRVLLKSLTLINVTGQGYNDKGEIFDENGKQVKFGDNDEMDNLVKACVICNEAGLYKEGEEWLHQGDAVDVALLGLSHKYNINPDKILSKIEKVKEIPFESEKKFAAVYYMENNDLKITVKGAAEVILSYVTSPDPAILKMVDKIAEEGYRVIAVAGNYVESIDSVILPELEFLGLIALIDPPRKEVKSAIENCHNAGVDVVMITGDHPATALAVGRELNIANQMEQLITGKELELLLKNSAAQIKESFRKVKIYSRVTPQQKQIIVAGLQEQGNFVAVTGDGVNDAPALKTANIGVAMGYGTDVAKDNSSIIITDNNFASISAGIEEGRAIYSNIRKIIYLLVSTGAAELIMIGLSILFGTPLPFLPVQLLWLNLVTNGIQDVSLAFEKGEKKLMQMPPRKPEESIFNSLMIQETLIAAVVMSAVAFSLWIHLLYVLHWETATARNTILLLMVLLQNFHVFNCRSETRSVFKIPLKNNLVLLLGVTIAQGLHIISMQLPFMQTLLSLEPVSVLNWLKLLGTAAIIIIILEIYKYFFIRKLSPAHRK